MKGSNLLILNADTVVEAFQEWITAHTKYGDEVPAVIGFVYSRKNHTVTLRLYVESHAE